MANKPISALAPITAAESVQQDLFLLSDVSAHESKKLTLGDLENYLLLSGDFFSGSFYGTSSWAQQAVSASYANVTSCSYSKTSSWAFNVASAIAATYATSALSASYALTSSDAITSSYALTCSVQVSSLSEFAKTASFILYSGIPNGTASYAITASNSNTASFLIYSGIPNGTASYSISASYAKNGIAPGGSYDISCSWASESLYSTYASNSYTTNYLNWYPGANNGTASYAMATGVYTYARTNYGVHQAMTQTLLQATIDCINVTGITDRVFYSSSIEVLGTVILPFTTSVETAGLIKLFSLDKWSGVTQSIDVTNVDCFITPASGAFFTGSVKFPFSLMGEVPMSGSNALYIVATGGVLFDPFRTVRFDVTSLASSVTVSPGEAMTFKVYPTGAIMTYTSSGVLYSGTYTDIISAGINTITEINAYNNGSTLIKYLWTLPNLSVFKCNTNAYLSDIGGLPYSITRLSCTNCVIPRLAPFTHTLMIRLECQNNQLITLPDLSPNTTYVNCSNNLTLINISSVSPITGLTTIIADYIGISAPPLVFPNSLVTMSFANNLALTLWYTPFPTSMTYFDCSHTSLTQIPTLPAGVLYLDVSYCNMTPIAIDDICTKLISNGLLNGQLIVKNNNGYMPATLIKFATLSGMGWLITSA